MLCPTHARSQFEERPAILLVAGWLGASRIAVMSLPKQRFA